MRYSVKVLKTLTEKYEILQKEMEEAMGVYIIKTDIDEALEKGIEKGMEQGIEKGRTEGMINSIKNLMMTMNLSVRQAMDALRIPEEERKKYIAML